MFKSSPLVGIDMAKLEATMSAIYAPIEGVVKDIRAKANEPGTLATHGPKYIEGLRCAADMIERSLLG